MTVKVKSIVAHANDPAGDLLRSLERFRPGVSLLDLDDAKASGSLEMAAAIRTGIASATWSRLRAIGFTPPELASVVGVSEKTISRKKGGHAGLTVAEGDRTVRLAQLTLDAARAFGDLDKAMRWLRKPNRVLGGEKPLDLIATEPGTVLVRRALGTVEYGGVA
jgi:putative toxin-antitoxin system antitoxin component (TIGR02293 family)